MSEFFQGNLWMMITVVTVAGCLIPIVAILTDHVRKLRQAELDNQLKREMLAQGRTLKEIETVLNMTPERGPWWAKSDQ